MCRKLLTYIVIVMLALTIFFPPCFSFAQEQKLFTIAVLDMDANGVSTVEAKGLSEKIRTRISWLVNNEFYKNNPGTNMYLVVERSQMDKIFEQFEIQNTGCTDISCAVEFGKMLQVDRIIIGSVNLIGQTYNVTTRMIDVGSSQTLSVSEVDYRGSIDGLVGSRIQDVADELLLGITFKDWERSEYITISGTPENTIVSINGEKAGTTPIVNRMVPAGNVSVEIQKRGYESHIEKISLRKGESVQIAYNLFPKTRGKTFIKSLYYPGSGQRYADYKRKGYLISFVQVVTIAGLIQTNMMSMDAQNEYDDAKDVYYQSASQDKYDRTYQLVQEKYDDVKQSHTFLQISAGVTATVYLYNIIDAALTKPKREDMYGEIKLFIEPRITKESSSIMVSMRF
ncbi:PEGA domain-containing protein [Candidatus Latescibacterota bacterium]